MIVAFLYFLLAVVVVCAVAWAVSKFAAYMGAPEVVQKGVWVVACVVLLVALILLLIQAAGGGPAVRLN